MQAAPQPRKGFQNLGFGGVLSSLSFAAERKGAAGGKTVAGECGLPRAQSVLAMTGFFARGAVVDGRRGNLRKTGSGGAEPRPYEWLANFYGRADVGIGPYEKDEIIA